MITEPHQGWKWTCDDDDKKLLQKVRDDRLNETKNWVGRGYVAGINRILEPCEKQRLVRTLIAVAIVNLLALLFFIVRPALGGLGNWLPFALYLAGGISVSVADLRKFEDQYFHTIPWLLVSILLAEVAALTGAGMVSSRVLRQLAKVEPMKRFIVPLALLLPYSRRRFFRTYVKSVRDCLEVDKRGGLEGEREGQEGDRWRLPPENYMDLPANRYSRDNPRTPTLDQEPAAEILRFLTESAPHPGRILLEAPSGRGKSALLRAVVERALNRFEKEDAHTPLPVLLKGKGDSLEKMAGSELAAVIAAPEFLGPHLESRHFFLVLDSVSESGPSYEAVEAFVKSSAGHNTPLLLGSLLAPKYREVVEKTRRWMVVEPRCLDDLLDEFVQHYGGELKNSLKAVCRGRDPNDGYLPILVRMAMTLGADYAPANVAHLYRDYLLRRFEARYPNEAGQRVQRLEEAGQWCLKTYWRDGERTCPYGGTELQQQLLHAGIVLATGGSNTPQLVHFFHNSMQSYLTAYGLWIQDQAGYAQLPRPENDTSTRPWDRGRVLRRAAADPRFTRAPSDLLFPGGSELFQMCLLTFPAERMRPWLRDELTKWTTDPIQGLKKEDVEKAIPPDVRRQIRVRRDWNGQQLLAALAELCFAADETAGSVAQLGAVYARVAPCIVEPEEGGDRDEPANDEGQETIPPNVSVVRGR